MNKNANKKAQKHVNENVIDKIIGYFAPGAAKKRALDRAMLSSFRSEKYAAAKTTRSTGGWSPVNSSVNDIIRASSPIVRARVRQLVRDFPYFARAVNVLVDYTVGSGIAYQSKIKKRSGELDTKLNDITEDVFKFWMDECDFSGRLHYNEMMRLAKRQDAEPGEFMLIRRAAVDKKAYLPVRIQMIETDWLTDLNSDKVKKTNTLDQGIEYESATGRIVAYHITDPDQWGKSMRIDAKDVIHSFETLRPGQLRGISPFAPGVLVADDLSNIMDSEIDATKMASKWVAIVKTLDPLGRQIGNGVYKNQEDDQPIEDLENAIIEYLRPGEDIELKSNPRPNSNLPAFVRMILCMFAVVAGVPYEMVSGDYQGMNYSVGRMVRNDFLQQLRSISARHIRHFCQPTHRWFMESAVLFGKISAPGYAFNSSEYYRAEWQPPGMESIDPSREVKARVDEIKNLLRSPQEVILARGRDPEDVLNEIEKFKKMAEERGLTIEEISTALANNPAALE